MRPMNRWIFALCAAGLLAACSKQELPMEKQASAVAASPGPAGKQTRLKACALVTEMEMGAFLGRAVTIKVDDSSAYGTLCTYSPATGVNQDVELRIDWGNADVAMGALGTSVRTDPYAGIGDKAVAIGPSLWIKKGEDLITIVGVNDAPVTAKQIYETAARRL